MRGPQALNRTISAMVFLCSEGDPVAMAVASAGGGAAGVGCDNGCASGCASRYDSGCDGLGMITGTVM